MSLLSPNRPKDPPDAPTRLRTVDEAAEWKQACADIEMLVKSRLPRTTSPRTDPPMPERQLGARHDVHQHGLNGDAIHRKEDLETAIAAGNEAITEAERIRAAHEAVLTKVVAEREMVDDDLAKDDPQRRFERYPPLMSYLGPSIAAIFDVQYTMSSLAYASNTTTTSVRAIAVGLVVIQMLLLHVIGVSLKDLSSSTMNAAKRTVRRRLTVLASVGATAVCAGIIAIRAAHGGSTWGDLLTFAGAQVGLSAFALTTAYVGHSPLGAERRRLLGEEGRLERLIRAQSKVIDALRAQVGSYEANLAALPQELADHRQAACSAFRNLVMRARTRAQSECTDHDQDDTERAEILELFPLPVLVVPEADEELGAEGLIPGPHVLALV